jgi:hypothetical protein
MKTTKKESDGLMILSILVFIIMPVSAQSGRARPKMEPTRPLSAPPPVSIINNPTPEFRSGEVSIAVRGNENPIIRLGLAPTGVTLIEFPASDRFFAINPGMGDLVTIEDSPTKETDHFFVIRAGAGFLPFIDSEKSAVPATSIIVQMSSGMTVTFLLYPVRDIERNAHRCVVTYDRDAIVKARLAAGLATNLDRRDEKNMSKQTGLSVRMTPAEVDSPTLRSASASSSIYADDRKIGDKPKKEDPTATALLTDVSFPSSDAKWSERLHGLKIAIQSRGVDENRRQLLVAVHNTLTKPVQIVPGYPDLFIHTYNNKGQVLHAESLKYRKVESAAPDGVIQPGRIVRFLITYQAPVLGAKQRLGVAVAQTNAADEPVMMELTPEIR